MDDPDSRRNESESLESLLAPLQELVALAVTFEFHLHIQAERFRRAGKIDLHGVIDDEVHRHERLDDFRIATEFFHRASHRGEIDDQRNAGEILENNACDHERDFLVRRRLRIPARERLDVLPPDFLPIAISQNRFEHDPDADRQTRNFTDALLFQRRQRMQESFPAVTGVELLQRLKFVAHFSSASFALILSKFGNSRASSLLSTY